MPPMLFNSKDKSDKGKRKKASFNSAAGITPGKNKRPIKKRMIATSVVKQKTDIRQVFKRSFICFDSVTGEYKAIYLTRLEVKPTLAIPATEEVAKIKDQIPNFSGPNFLNNKV